MGKSPTTCVTFLMITFISLSIAIIVLLAKGYKKSTKHDKYFHDINENLQSTGFSDIKV